jgi:DNA polymerase-1
VSGLICGWDYSQIELRVAADLAHCGRMLEIFHEDKVDVHVATAREILRVLGVRKKSKDITPDERQNLGKTPNFQIIFECSPESLVRQASEHSFHLSLRDAGKVIYAWYERYPEFKPWQERQRAFVLERGYIQLPTGDREYIYADPSSAEGRKGLRMAVNTPIQGGASKICSSGFCLIQRACLWPPFWGNAMVIGMVYDSIVCDVRMRIRDSFKAMGEKYLTNGGNLVGKFGWRILVPLKVEWKEGHCLKGA